MKLKFESHGTGIFEGKDGNPRYALDGVEVTPHVFSVEILCRLKLAVEGLEKVKVNLAALTPNPRDADTRVEEWEGAAPNRADQIELRDAFSTLTETLRQIESGDGGGE